MLSKRDFSPVHRWIADHFFESQAWVYNGAGADVALPSGATVRVYVCRARDMRDGRHGLSHVAIQSFDSEWAPLTRPKLLPIITADPDAAQTDTGPQDARVFSFRGDVWTVFNMLCADGYRRMHIYNVTGMGNAIPIRIDGQDRSRTEKNWTPFVFNGELFFIYYFAPLVILRCDVETGRCSVVFSSGDARRPELRGGSPALRTAEDPTHFFGWLHTTVPLKPADAALYDPDELPTPARETAHVYRARRFELVFGRPETAPKLTVHAKERVFAGKQIEQIYGFGGTGGSQWAIVNVNDGQTVALNPDDDSSLN